MDLFSAIQPLRSSMWSGYLAAVVAPLVAVALPLACGGAFAGFPFLTFYPVVLVTAFIGGWAPGLIATALSGAFAAYFLIEPLYSFSVGGLVGEIQLGLFAGVSATIVGLVHTVNNTLARLSAAGSELRRTNETLEQRVISRTRDLEDLNATLRGEIETRMTAEAQLRHAQKMEALGQLTGGIAHDFNNMLAIVVSSLDLAKQRMSRDDFGVEANIDSALDGANRAAELTRRLLTFSRRTPLAPVIIDVNTLVRDMAELLQRTIGPEIQLRCVLADHVWHTDVDPGQLENAILNLAVNARDAMQQGGLLTIATSNTERDDAGRHYVLVAVSDSGTGMPPEVAARAFEPFFTTKEVGRGTGLGLSQVYGFVRQSGGHVGIESQPGRGTTVQLFLRSTLAPAAPSPPAALAPAPMGAADEIILVVEDEAMVRETTVAILQELGYTVHDAASGQEALAILAEQPAISLLFTDVAMPGMTGRQLANIVTQRRPEVKILYTTGYIPNEIFDPDGAEVLYKPFKLGELARRVRTILHQPPEMVTLPPTG